MTGYGTQYLEYMSSLEKAIWQKVKNNDTCYFDYVSCEIWESFFYFPKARFGYEHI